MVPLRRKFISFDKMNIFHLCLIATLIAGTCCKTSVKTPVIIEKFEKLSSTIDQKIYENNTSKIEEENDFESVGKFVAHLLGPLNDEIQAPDPEEGRTFGIKRLQFMLMPMMYKMGVMMTMLTVLTVISLKGLAIGVILLVLKLSAFFGKFYAYTQPHHVPYQGWSAQPQPVHVHVHNNGGGHHHHQQPYNGWEAVSGAGDDEHYYYKG